MRIVLRIAAFAWLALLLSLPVLGADEKDKKADPPKDDAKKTEVKKDEPAKKAEVKKDEPAKNAEVKKDEPAKKAEVKKDEPAKKAEVKKDEPAKKPDAPAPKMPAMKGKLKGYDTDPAAAEKKMMTRSSVQATIMAVVEDKKSLRLKITIPYVRVNQGQLQNYINAQMSMMQARNAQGIYNAQNQMAQAQAQLYELASVDKEVEWTAEDDLKVRMNNPPPQFDDKGRIKKYTAKQLKELKGTDKLPGYPAEFSDIKTGQIVSVTLLQKKTAPRTPKRGKAGEGELLDDNQPKISHIIILAEPKN